LFDELQNHVFGNGINLTMLRIFLWIWCSLNKKFNSWKGNKVALPQRYNL